MANFTKFMIHMHMPMADCESKGPVSKGPGQRGLDPKGPESKEPE